MRIRDYDRTVLWITLLALIMGMNAVVASAQSGISSSGPAHGAFLHLTVPLGDRAFADPGAHGDIPRATPARRGIPGSVQER